VLRDHKQMAWWILNIAIVLIAAIASHAACRELIAARAPAAGRSLAGRRPWMRCSGWRPVARQNPRHQIDTVGMHIQRHGRAPRRVRH